MPTEKHPLRLVRDVDGTDLHHWAPRACISWWPTQDH
jgi:hypothetical protein